MIQMGRVEPAGYADGERPLSKIADSKKPGVIPGPYFGSVPTTGIRLATKSPRICKALFNQAGVNRSAQQLQDPKAATDGAVA
jgi:hypothetical protein